MIHHHHLVLSLLSFILSNYKNCMLLQQHKLSYIKRLFTDGFPYFVCRPSKTQNPPPLFYKNIRLFIRVILGQLKLNTSQKIALLGQLREALICLHNQLSTLISMPMCLFFKNKTLCGCKWKPMLISTICTCQCPAAG